MAETNNKQRVTIIVQVIILVLFCAGLAALAVVFGVFNRPKDYRNVTLRVENPSGSVQLLYSIPGDITKDAIQVTTPWEKTISVKSGGEVYVTALNPSDLGEIKCSILLDGKSWKKDSATFPNDKVYCAGIVP